MQTLQNHWPSMLLVSLLLVSLGIDCGTHGKEKTTRVNAWVTLFSSLVAGYLYYLTGMFSWVK